MIKLVRSSMFETNSSSCHTIVLKNFVTADEVVELYERVNSINQSEVDDYFNNIVDDSFPLIATGEYGLQTKVFDNYLDYSCAMLLGDDFWEDADIEFPILLKKLLVYLHTTGQGSFRLASENERYKVGYVDHNSVDEVKAFMLLVCGGYVIGGGDGYVDESWKLADKTMKERGDTYAIGSGSRCEKSRQEFNNARERITSLQQR